MSTEQDIHLVPELCSIFGLTAEIRALSKLLPALIVHLNDTRQSFDKIAVLEKSLGFEIKDAKLKKKVIRCRLYLQAPNSVLRHSPHVHSVNSVK